MGGALAKGGTSEGAREGWETRRRGGRTISLEDERRKRFHPNPPKNFYFPERADGERFLHALAARGERDSWGKLTQLPAGAWVVPNAKPGSTPRDIDEVFFQAMGAQIMSMEDVREMAEEDDE